MGSIAAVMQTFFAESRGLLVQMEQDLLRLEVSPADVDAIDAVFRAAHTIKGSAGLFSFDRIEVFTHRIESVLEQVRRQRWAGDPELIDVMLQCRDHLGHLLDAAIAEVEPDAVTLAENERLQRCLQALLDGAEVPALPVVGKQPQVAPVGQETGADDIWHIAVRFGPDLFRKGLSPAPLLRHLGTLGEIVHVTTIADALPPAEMMDPESCYLGLEIRLCSSATKAEIESTFEFVLDDCLLRILPPGSRVEDYLRLIEELPEDRVRLGELLVACGAVTEYELAGVLAMQQGQRGGSGALQPLGELAVQQLVASREVVHAALSRQQGVRGRKAAEGELIRVQVSKLDRLIDRVGEVVIANAGIAHAANQPDQDTLPEAVSELTRLIEDLRDDAMRLRMVEIGEVFNRFHRVVRDLSGQLGKEIELVIEGADTELDKSLVERIAEPLTHLIRNAIDHGIEPAEQRLSRGKPARGRIRLAAHHQGGNVVIEVADDGAGLDRDRIIAKARQRGCIDDDVRLSDADAWELIFAPGFSTASAVTGVSGRGVGMDVVRQSIESMRGTLEINSVEGCGTAFVIRQPLTLAIIDGFQVGVRGSHYVIPLDTVIECIELAAGDGESGYLSLRGEVLPLLHVGEHFGLGLGTGKRRSVVVVHHLGRKAGLVVDQLEGELQIVIKPMGRLLSRAECLSGTTILGTGEIALVLDIPSLLASVAGNGRDASTSR